MATVAPAPILEERPSDVRREPAARAARSFFDLRAAWIWILSAGLVLYLGIEGGGYDLVVRNQAGVVVWWVLLLGAAFGVLPAARLSRAGWIAMSLFGAFLVWSAIASTWSLSSERSLQEVSRVGCYFGVLLLALLTYGDRRRALRHAVGAVATALVVVIGLALLARLRPGTFPSGQTAAFLPGAKGRLNWPLDYWNGLAALVALAVPLLLSIATSARRTAIQALAAAAIPMAALCCYMTLSRGGAIALAFGLAVFIALAPERIPKLATLLVSAAGSAILIAGAVHRSALEQGLNTAAARHEGASLLLALIAVCVLVGLAQSVIGTVARLARRRGGLTIPARPAGALLALGVVVALVAFLALHGPGATGPRLAAVQGTGRREPQPERAGSLQHAQRREPLRLLEGRRPRHARALARRVGAGDVPAAVAGPRAVPRLRDQRALALRGDADRHRPGGPCPPRRVFARRPRGRASPRGAPRRPRGARARRGGGRRHVRVPDLGRRRLDLAAPGPAGGAAPAPRRRARPAALGAAGGGAGRAAGGRRSSRAGPGAGGRGRSAPAWSRSPPLRWWRSGCRSPRPATSEAARPR